MEGKYLRRTQWMVTFAILSRLGCDVAGIGYMMIDCRTRVTIEDWMKNGDVREEGKNSNK